MGYVIVTIFLVLVIFVYVMYPKKTNTHFELLSSIDPSLNRYPGVFHLHKRQIEP